MSIADWKIIDNELAHDDLPAELIGDYIVEPYPPFFWTVSGGRIIKSGLLDCNTVFTTEKHS